MLLDVPAAFVCERSSFKENPKEDPYRKTFLQHCAQHVDGTLRELRYPIVGIELVLHLDDHPVVDERSRT